MRGRELVPEPRRALFAVAGVSTALMLVANLVTGIPGAGIVDVVTYTITHVAVAGLCLTARPVSRQERVAWPMIAVSILLMAAGNVAYYVGNDDGIADRPYPAVSDLLYAAGNLVVYVALLLLICARLFGSRTIVWLDGLVGALGAAALGAAVVTPLLDLVGGRSAEVIVNVSYPIADLLILLLLGGTLTALGGRIGRPLAVIGLAVGVYTIGDATYFAQDAHGTYVEGGALDLTWLVANILLGVAATLTDPVPPARPGRLPGWGYVTFPTAFALAALGLLVAGEFVEVPATAGVLAGACLLAGMARAALTFHEVRQLADSRREARTDELTGLGNRRFFFERAEALLGGRADGERVPMLLVDLDRFKEVNDSLGHHVGDDLLRLAGPRIRGCLGAADVAARLGGDEFAVLLAPGAEDRAEAAADRIRAALTAPFRLAELGVHIDASIGIAVAPDHGTEAATLLRRADVAMYQAKARGGGYRFYTPEGDVHDRRRLETIERLREAIRDGDLALRYQPKVRLSDGVVVGAEATVCWERADGEPVPAAEVLALAEQAGQTRALATAVVDAAAAQAAGWRAAGIALPIAINLSASDLADDTVLDHLAAAVDRYPLPADALQLEITEDTLLEEPERTRAAVRRLRAAGHHVAVDDYGTRHSSLAYLRQLDVDELKLHRTFLVGFGRDPHALEVVRHTVGLAHALDLRMVADGVQSASALLLLATLGCDVAQGAGVAEPMTAAELTVWLGARVPAATWADDPWSAELSDLFPPRPRSSS